MSSLLLNYATWDLTVDASGNIALTDTPTLQDVSCALRLFNGELWYNTARGMPYWESILGKQPPSNFLKLKMENMAKTVPNVAKAQVFITGFDSTRRVRGQVQVTTTDGVKQAVTL